MSTPSSAIGPAELDWDEARRFLRGRFETRLRARDDADLDDLVQEACIRLLRAVRRESIQDSRGLMIVIADRTWKDFLRRRYRTEQRFGRLDEERDHTPDPRSVRDHMLGDLQARLELVLLEIFEREGADECRRLAQAYFGAQDWKSVAQEQGIGYAAVRKRWSRCLEIPRRIMRSDPQFRHLLHLD